MLKLLLTLSFVLFIFTSSAFAEHDPKNIFKCAPTSKANKLSLQSENGDTRVKGVVALRINPDGAVIRIPEERGSVKLGLVQNGKVIREFGVVPKPHGAIDDRGDRLVFKREEGDTKDIMFYQEISELAKELPAGRYTLAVTYIKWSAGGGAWQEYKPFEIAAQTKDNSHLLLGKSALKK